MKCWKETRDRLTGYYPLDQQEIESSQRYQYRVVDLLVMKSLLNLLFTCTSESAVFALVSYDCLMSCLSHPTGALYWHAALDTLYA